MNSKNFHKGNGENFCDYLEEKGRLSFSVQEKLYIIEAYDRIEEKSGPEIRKNGERVFDHLITTADLLLEISENVTADEIIGALLHDSIEDGHKNFSEVQSGFGNKTAVLVAAISKKPWEDFLNDQEDIFIEIRAKVSTLEKIEKQGKLRRNKEYWSRFKSYSSMKKYVEDIAQEHNIELDEKDLNEIVTNIFNIKFADRIHNLSTQIYGKIEDIKEKVKEKVDETIENIAPIASKLNQKAYKLLSQEIIKLKKELNK